MTLPPSTSRRGVLAAVGGGLAMAGAAVLGSDVVLPALSLRARQPAGEWPMAKRDPQRSGYQPQPAPETGLSEVWQRRAGEANILESGLVATGGRVLTAGRYALRALDGADGSLDWKRRQPDQFRSGFPDEPQYEFVQAGPAVSGDSVYSVSAVTLYERDAGTGDTGWAFRTNSSFSRVLPVGNAVFAGVYLDGAHRLVALDQSTGHKRWTRVVDEVPLAFGSAADAGQDADLLVNGAGTDESVGALVGRDPTDGSERWRTSETLHAFDGVATPAVGQGRVYAGGNPLVAVDAADGSTSWTAALPELSGVVSPVTDGDRVYVAGGGTAVALDATTGERAWTVSFGETSRYVPPVVADRTLYLATGSTVVALDVSDGAERFRHTVSDGDAPIYDLVSADGRLYVRAGNSVRAFGPPGEGEQ